MRRPRLVPDNTKIPFFRYRWIAFAWSLFVLVGDDRTGRRPGASTSASTSGAACCSRSARTGPPTSR